MHLLWEEPPEQRPHRALAVELEVKLIIRIVAPEVSPQAVDQIPITITNPPRTVGPIFYKTDTKCRVRTGKLCPTNTDLFKVISEGVF